MKTQQKHFQVFKTLPKRRIFNLHIYKGKDITCIFHKLDHDLKLWDIMKNEQAVGNDSSFYVEDGEGAIFQMKKAPFIT